MTKRMIIAALALAGAGLATYLAMYKLGLIGELACNVGQCETVNLSRWATLLGIPVAVWGVGFYVALFAVAFAGTTSRFADAEWVSHALLALTGWGVIFSAWLTYLELFVIHAVCMFCVISAVLVTVTFLVSVLEWRGRPGR
ncbi:MAG: vitamin K epoxide reductase family protein [Gemmatimonadaceae bacterium]|nr:vitamin K epoxide reductase family protein [Gemmatimonadaceae bacterium]